jgi:nitroreductase
MNNIWQKVRPLVRGIYRILSGLNGFAYDFKRFLLYSSWWENLKLTEVRNYNMVVAYHGLEKSLSFKNRNPNSGWSNAERVFSKLKIANELGVYGYHDKAGKQVLEKFLRLPENISKNRSKEMLSEMNLMDFDSSEDHGAQQFELNSFRQGVLKNPEAFFLSRYSLREFSKEIVEIKHIERALKLAMKTPSVCNRQEWHVHYSDNPVIIDKVLQYQNGNSPFRNKIPNLMVITIDLRAFFTGPEHYQHWIDGGLFSMSIIYSLHSLGIASCPLNWSQTPKMDKELRKAMNLENHQTVIMMIALGYPESDNKVCSSKRRPLGEIITEIKLK